LKYLSAGVNSSADVERKEITPKIENGSKEMEAFFVFCANKLVEIKVVIIRIIILFI
jgi:hypothetical protein